MNRRRLEIATGDLLHSQLDDLLHVRSTTAAVPAYAGRPNDITRRMGPVSYKTANLSIGDSAALANEHWLSS